MTIAIARITCLECLRRPMPYIAVAAIVALTYASHFLHFFTFGAGTTEAADLAISAVLLAGLVTTALIGTALVRADLERGTLALLLSQPVGLCAYVVGRFIGLAIAALLVCALAAAGVASSLLLAVGPGAPFSAPLLLGWARVALAVLVLAAAALAASAATSRVFAPILLLALFLAADITRPSAVSRVLPDFGILGLGAEISPPFAWLALYVMLYCVVFLVTTYLQLALRPPTRSES